MLIPQGKSDSRKFYSELFASPRLDPAIRPLLTHFLPSAQVHIPLDPSTKQSKGLAYVTFAQALCALAAYEALDKKSFQGRLLHVLAAVDRKGKVQVEEAEGRKKTVKDEREGKRKAMAGKEFNWGMLYMNVSFFFFSTEPIRLSLSSRCLVF
jgi:multiple RNA-binding domain-containing protein 1